MAILLYNLSVKTYIFLIHIASIFNPKAKRWVVGRKGWRDRYRSDWQSIRSNEAFCVWMHCASLGEFEQGRPLLELLKKEAPQVKIVLTFFSPSGYEIRKNYAHADYVCYLPADTAQNATDFINIFKPNLCIFVKYEFWANFLRTLQSKNIPILLIAALFRSDQIFFKWFGTFFRKLLTVFTHIFTQNQSSADLLKSIHIQDVKVAGDTRIDRVLQIAKEAARFETIEQFVGDNKILVVGSSWQPDEALLFPFLNRLPTDWKAILAPHDISETHLQTIEQGLVTTYSRFSQIQYASKVLIIDNIGMLSALYRYGKIAYIGGGFGVGIHNTLEPIAFGLPVVFGPKYQKFEEANQLLKNGGAFTIVDAGTFERTFEHLSRSDFYKQASEAARRYIEENQGATQLIFSFIRAHFLHTKM